MKFDMMKYMLDNIDVYGNEKAFSFYDNNGYISFGDYLNIIFHNSVSNTLFRNLTKDVEFVGGDSSKKFETRVYRQKDGYIINIVSIRLVGDDPDHKNLELLEYVIDKELSKFIDRSHFQVYKSRIKSCVFITFENFDNVLDFFRSFKTRDDKKKCSIDDLTARVNELKGEMGKISNMMKDLRKQMSTLEKCSEVVDIKPISRYYIPRNVN